MKNCLDTGTIQAFLDGEMTPAEAAIVSAHIAICDACAAQLATAEDESAFVFSVLEREMDALVPTQRLWNKINDSIDVERHRAPFWKKAWAYITIAFANPSLVGAAALLMVFGAFAIVMIQRDQTVDNGTIAGEVPLVSHPAQSIKSAGVNNEGETATKTEPTTVTNAPAVATAASYRPQQRSGNVRSNVPTVQRAVYIPGEESYVKTIATLNETVEDQKAAVLRPSERISYERDMAVVNDAIKKMRQEVRRNPKNESAKQVLYTSYQNKIDLLNSVSQREELVAGIRD